MVACREVLTLCLSLTAHRDPPLEEASTNDVLIDRLTCHDVIFKSDFCRATEYFYFLCIFIRQVTETKDRSSLIPPGLGLFKCIFPDDVFSFHTVTFMNSRWSQVFFKSLKSLSAIKLR